MEEHNNYYGRIDVDNHLGYLHNAYRHIVKKSTIEPVLLKSYSDKLPNVYIGNNVLSKKFAKRVRNFINNIPIDNNSKELHDIDNPPRTNVHTSLNDIEKTLLSEKNKICDPTQWAWEKYNIDFWRAVPLTPEAFFGSPIIELFDIMEERLRATKFDNTDFTSLYKATWVIQRMNINSSMRWHDDFTPYRELSFIYYLTSDKWDDEYGGKLAVSTDGTKQNYESILPTFNTLVAWKTNQGKSPLHAVFTTKKHRISLVGFFDWNYPKY